MMATALTTETAAAQLRTVLVVATGSRPGTASFGLSTLPASAAQDLLAVRFGQSNAALHAAAPQRCL